MSSRAQKILNLAVSVSENQFPLNRNTYLEPGSSASIPVSKAVSALPDKSGDFSSNPVDEVVALTDISYSCVIENECPTKLRLRKVCENTYNETSPNSEEEFSAGSSDNFEPSSDDDSSSSLTKSPDSERIIRQKLPSTSETVESDDDNPSPKKGKKRLRNTETWVSEKAKKLKNSGKSYKSRTGKVVEAKKMGAPCPEKCVLSCSKKISETHRALLFKEYWEMTSLQRQRDFLGSCIEQLQLKYRRITAGVPRKPNCAFYLLINGQKIRVCKKFLINTLAITERTIRTVIQSKVSGTGIMATDNRGKHGKHRKVDEELVKSIRDHISLIPRVESHNVRKDTKREFIDGGLSIAELYRYYSNERSSAGKPVATYDMYARIFNAGFNIGFFVPKKDQCDLCESYKNSVENDKQALEIKYQEHLEEKKLSRAEKDEDKERAKNKEITLAVYDLQAVLPVPTGQTSAFFYKSRLNCYNFTITEIGNDKSYCYFWHEGLGHRRVTEIGSCLLDYLRELARSKPGIDIVLYSDNCGGQQKNRYMIATYLYAVEVFDIKSITHKYLVRGHTQNEGDAVHSIIEKAVKKAKNSGPLYVPGQYVLLIRNAKKKGIPLDVKEMNFTDFFDIKALHGDIAPSLLKNIDEKEFRISDVKLLQFQKGSEVIRYKLSFKQLNWDSVEFRSKKTRVPLKPYREISLKPAYKNKISLTDNKKKDLKS